MNNAVSIVQKLSNQQWLALSLLLLLLLLLYWLLFSPIVGAYRATLAQLGDMQFQLQRYQHLAAAQQENRDNLQVWLASSGNSQFYVEGASYNLAAANLQEYFRNLVRQNGGQIVSTQGITSSEQNEQGVVAIKVQFSGSVAQVTRTLSQLETGKPLLQLDNVDIVSSSRRPQARTRSSRNKTTVTARKGATSYSITARFDLIGFLSPERKSLGSSLPEKNEPLPRERKLAARASLARPLNTSHSPGYSLVESYSSIEELQR